MWLKAFHIALVVSWFAGLFYLPRIFVNLAQETDDAAYARLLGMAARLYRFVTPLMLLALVSGVWLWLQWWTPTPGWLWAKLVLIAGLVGYHHACKAHLARFAAKRNTRSHIWFRWFNEVPVLALFAIVVLVVVKPF